MCALGLSASQQAEIAAVRQHVEKADDDDAESIVTMARYDLIAQIVPKFVTKAPKRVSATERIDRIVTNRWLGLPIFVVIMTFVYWVSVSTVGTWAPTGPTTACSVTAGTSWPSATASTTRPSRRAAGARTTRTTATRSRATSTPPRPRGIDTSAAQQAIDAGEYDAQAVVDFQQQAADAGVVATVDVRDADGNYLDTEGNPVPYTFVDGQEELQLAEGQQLQTMTVDATAFQTALDNPEPDPSEYGIWVPGVPELVSGGLDAIGMAEDSWVRSLILDGIVAGVGAVLGFVPQMIVLFILLGFLEDCGYLARVAFIMDRIFRRFGLSGKSFIPMLISRAAAFPASWPPRRSRTRASAAYSRALRRWSPAGRSCPSSRCSWAR